MLFHVLPHFKQPDQQKNGYFKFLKRKNFIYVLLVIRSRSRSSSSSPPENRVPSPPPLKSYRRPSLSSKSSSDFSSDDESATKSSSTGHFSKDNADDRSQDATSSKWVKLTAFGNA
jgi:hypothetical protein